ncbi:MAG: hypothetical protein QOE54_5765 [Streptosporangiaceae bacterium]|jgi:hypothetical protein|nr:hypothetical protein [Streptosporangiaceae bacterium]MDX6433399.1 hypothetical protein [Streptosporangiaceae bacterium]
MTDRRVDEDMGDDEQASEISQYETYIADPPDDLVITETDEQGSIGISEWAREEASSRERPAEDDERPAEESAMKVRPEE